MAAPSADSPLLSLKEFLAGDTIDLHAGAEAVLNLIAIAWAIHAINWAFCGGGLNQVFHRRPREVGGLLTLFTSPFLHGVVKDRNGEVIDGSHIISNTIAFAILGSFIALQGLRFFYVVTILIALLGGFGAWLLGVNRGVGASGVIYGYIGFLLVYGFTSGSGLAFVLGLITLVLYRRFPIGMLPIHTPFGRLRIGWDAHLYGFIAGVLTAYAIGVSQTL